MTALALPAMSKEYLHGVVVSNVSLDAQPVEVAILGPAASPDGSTTWYVAEWEGDAATTRSWRLLVGPTTTVALTPGVYSVWYRVTDVTETPVRKHADTLTVS